MGSASSWNLVLTVLHVLRVEKLMEQAQFSAFIKGAAHPSLPGIPFIAQTFPPVSYSS